MCKRIVIFLLVFMMTICSLPIFGETVYAKETISLGNENNSILFMENTHMN
ncbi:hypothetical protein [Butyrivibrio sp. NC3005]|uniref:hypothetical protein n=1 Tax=Butyrivibrio sp. NC3005 TaxID=1280685 RepID=UPI00041CB1FA|nr:hypothetical protein [Butyrivibrio sp. NC3005]